MKVLHVLSSDKFSGAENVACQIIEGMKAESVESYYASLDGKIRENLKDRGVNFIPLKKSNPFEVHKAITLVKPDVIHAHDMKASFNVALSCGRIPFVSHIHNNNYNSRSISVKSLLYLIAAKRAKHIFWVSKSSFDGYRFHNLVKKRSTVLYNVINIEELKNKVQEGICEYEYDCLFLGRITYQKNPERLLNVMEKIILHNPNVKIAIVGNGDLYEKIRAEAIQKGILKNIDFLGFLNNPYKILYKCKVMLMTSRWEGTPMCALEAMSLGVPIVSTPTDGLCDLIKNGYTGYLSDDDDELARFCLKIIEDKDLHDQLSANSQRNMSNTMNIDRYIQVILSEYKKMYKGL